MKGKCSVKCQIDGQGFYCNLTLDVVPIEKTGIELVYDPNSIWYSAVRFAVDYFYESYSILHKKGLRVVIDEVQTMDVDTSSMIVFYVTLQALLDATGSRGCSQIAMTQDGSFIFPKVFRVPQ